MKEYSCSDISPRLKRTLSYCFKEDNLEGVVSEVNFLNLEKLVNKDLNDKIKSLRFITTIPSSPLSGLRIKKVFDKFIILISVLNWLPLNLNKLNKYLYM